MLEKKLELRERGFTLIELLVVVSLIGVLTTLVMANLNAARQRGRDSQRKSDLRNIQTALGLYYNDFGKYPANSANAEIVGCDSLGTETCAWGESFEAKQVYMQVLPSDPLPNVPYSYEQIDLDNYLLKACLENKSDEKGVDDPTTAGWCPTQFVYTVRP